MPPQKKKTPNKARKQTAQTDELAQITKMLTKMQQPKNQVTDLGRGLLRGGNMVSSMFGFPKIFGSGSYSMKSNSLWNATSQVPIMHSSSETITLRHREYIGDISINGPAFTSTVYAVNPGLAGSFPFLSQIADNFQEYGFKGLVYEFKSTSATALASGTNTALGSVMLAAQYRSDAPALTTKVGLLNEMWSVDTPPSQNAVLPIECAPSETVLSKQYIRSGPPTGDIKMFDLCSLVVATSGGQVGQTNVVGELWASYEVELRKPQVVSSVPCYMGSSTSTPTNVTSLNGTVALNFSNLAVNVGATFIQFPTGCFGYYSVYVIWVGTAAGGASAPPEPTLTNCVYAGLGHPRNVPTTASVTYSFYCIINITNPVAQANMLFGAQNVPGGTFASNIIITPIANNQVLWT